MYSMFVISSVCLYGTLMVTVNSVCRHQVTVALQQYNHYHSSWY